MDTIEAGNMTHQFFLSHLESKMSGHNAKMILDSAFLQEGLSYPYDQELNKEQSQNLCLALIKKGGPAFKVGTEIYKKYHKN